MLAFFGMIVNFFGWFSAFFIRFTSFSNSASGLFNIRVNLRRTLYIIYNVLVVAYVVLCIAFFYFMIDVIGSTYNLISALIIKIQTINPSGGSSPSPSILQPLYLLLNTSGIASGVSAAFPFVASALIFRLAKALYNTILPLHYQLLYFYRTTVDGILAP